jgi:hypothetical protein
MSIPDILNSVDFIRIFRAIGGYITEINRYETAIYREICDYCNGLITGIIRIVFILKGIIKDHLLHLKNYHTKHMFGFQVESVI